MLVKYSSETGIPLPQIMFWRQAVPIVMIAGWLALTGALGRLHTRRLGSHARRGVLGTIGMSCGFAASILLSLADATTLSFTTPLFAVIIGGLLLRERIGRWRWAAVALGLAGVVIIAHPGQAPMSALGAAAGLGGGLLVAVVTFQVRDLARTDEPISVVFYFALFGGLLTVPFLPFYAVPLDARQWLLRWVIPSRFTRMPWMKQLHCRRIFRLV